MKFHSSEVPSLETSKPMGQLGYLVALADPGHIQSPCFISLPTISALSFPEISQIVPHNNSTT